MRTRTFPVRTWRMMEVRRRSARGPSHLVVEHMTRAVLRAPEEADFPVAAEIVPLAHLAAARPPRSIFFRALDGHLYRPMRIRDEAVQPHPFLEHLYLGEEYEPPSRVLAVHRGVVEFSEDLIADGFDRGIDETRWDSPFGPFPAPREQIQPEAFYAPAIREVLSDGIAAADLRVATAAERLVLFGGLLWERTMEPVWRVEDDIVSLELDVPRHAGDSFRLDRLDEARECALAATGGPIAVTGDVVSVVPELLRRDDRSAVVYGIAARLSEQAASPFVQLLPTAAFERWISFRIAFERGMPADSAAADDLADAVGHLLRAFDSIGMNGFGRADFEFIVMRWLRIPVARFEAMGGSLVPRDLVAADEEAFAALGEG